MERLLEQKEAEGLTFRQLSEQSGVGTPALSYWASKLRRERMDPSEPPTFKRVTVVDDPLAGSITVEVAGIGLRVGPGFDPDHLARIVKALATRC